MDFILFFFKQKISYGAPTPAYIYPLFTDWTSVERFARSFACCSIFISYSVRLLGFINCIQYTQVWTDPSSNSRYAYVEICACVGVERCGAGQAVWVEADCGWAVQCWRGAYIFVGICMFGVMNSLYGNTRRAYEFGEVGKTLSERFKIPSQTTKCYFIYYALLNCWYAFYFCQVFDF